MLIFALAAIGLLAIPATAATTERIVVYGAVSGSHLKVSTSGSSIVVDGIMAEAEPQGCRFTHGHHAAVCPIGDADAIEIDMGPNGDKVEILDPLPFPLTVRLGSGEDKFIGNSEVDLCYPEGTKRNRCVGNRGDDVCITGSRNSDCVGGAGDDYCRHGAGSDGCWGGPGNDVCVMGPGQDGCHGDGGNDRLFGEQNPDQLYGGEGYDYCDGGRGVGYSHTCEAGPRR